VHGLLAGIIEPLATFGMFFRPPHLTPALSPMITPVALPHAYRLLNTGPTVLVSAAVVRPGQHLQSGHYAYPVADRVNHASDGKVVFNRLAGLKDGWGK
jgi:hypothetical protein